ncbi:MAG: hypothetical protein BWY63_02229 [Chloroflexi bacterium ADurb.Bin360]|nr:MAG: hypothetical protein BWY63_02229 [Chloroflexi bacterium ADurb.Bin360]
MASFVSRGTCSLAARGTLRAVLPVAGAPVTRMSQGTPCCGSVGANFVQVVVINAEVMGNLMIEHVPDHLTYFFCAAATE